MAIDLLQARFRPTSGWPTIRELIGSINTRNKKGQHHRCAGVEESAAEIVTWRSSG